MNCSAADIWERVLSLMQQTMTETTITTWFSDAEPIAPDENRFILYVPTDFKGREIVASRWRGISRRPSMISSSSDMELEVVVLSEEEKEKYGKREPVIFLPGTEEYTFERFVVGNSNKFAHAASLAVAEHPAENYNPSSSTGNPDWARPICSTPSPTPSIKIIQTIKLLHPGRTLPTSSSGTFGQARTRSSGTSTAPPTSSSWTTSSSSPAGTPPRRRCSIPSTPFMRTKSRSSLPPTVPPRRCSGWRTG